MDNEEQAAEAGTHSYRWPPLESNPEIINKYMYKVGMDADWALHDMFGLDEELLCMVPQPCVGVVATIERVDKADGKPGAGYDSTVCPFYMKQSSKLDNACGIIACIHTVLNNQAEVKVSGESILGRFITGSKDLNPAERAKYLEDFTDFQREHVSSAGEGETQIGDTKHHFVTFVPGPNGELIELDGTKDGPAIIQEHCENFLLGVATEIKRRISEGKITGSLNMMAFCKAT